MGQGEIGWLTELSGVVKQVALHRGSTPELIAPYKGNSMSLHRIQEERLWSVVVARRRCLEPADGHGHSGRLAAYMYLPIQS